MKPIIHASVLCGALAAGLMLLAGCSSTGMERSEQTTITMQIMDRDIQDVTAKVNATGKSLDELLRPGQPDVKKAFADYSENVEAIETLEQRFVKHTDEMTKQGTSYFEEWRKEGDTYKNPQIQMLSEQRRAELGQVYGRIAENSIGVRDALAAYRSDVKEIQLYLSNDLTAKGIEAIQPVAAKVVRDGDHLNNALRAVQSAINRAREEMQ